jgi:hypothetical protein
MVSVNKKDKKPSSTMTKLEAIELIKRVSESHEINEGVFDKVFVD